MKQLIHDLVTGVKYLYPCIAFDEPSSNKELIIITETDISRLYPAQPKVAGMTFIGEDFWGRETFKDIKGQYFCDVDGVLHFKGNDIEGDPHWPVKDVIEYDLPQIDPEISEFKECLQKAQHFFQSQEKVDLIDSQFSLSSPTREGKIVATFKLKIKE